ncbi:PspC domain-containing protein [Micromonospora costi]|uniref:PspC domain-containing protein n=1 Tax=Micromonospora costi TaxID=1530042 RepID=A0A3B0A0K4_9ACTN|nr:PspC domain-containing protein [Micromonospora costi]RKN54085.1 PspC domain-containing protein [Micromonospora costi]
MNATIPPQPPYKQLRRPTTDRMVAGVASGVGRYFDVDPTLVRVIFAVTGLLTGGLALIAYPIMWFLMPEEPAGAPAWPHPTGAAAYAPPPAGTASPPAAGQPTGPAPAGPYPPAGPSPRTMPYPPAGPGPAPQAPAAG